MFANSIARHFFSNCIDKREHCYIPLINTEVKSCHYYNFYLCYGSFCSCDLLIHPLPDTLWLYWPFAFEVPMGG